MSEVTFARAAEPRCERSQMWLIARHVQAERTSFAKRVFCQEGVWQSARYSQTLTCFFQQCTSGIIDISYTNKSTLRNAVGKRNAACG
jgi:hypothetical protein